MDYYRHNAPEATIQTLDDAFIEAVASLNDLTMIRSSPEVALLRTYLMERNYRNSAFPDGLVRTLEIAGIQRAVANRFHEYGRCAGWRAFCINWDAKEQFDGRSGSANDTTNTNTLVLGADEDAFRIFLRKHLDWIHEYGTFQDGAPDSTISCLSPTTAYLQLVVYETPVEDWAAAVSEAANFVSGLVTSPLSSALALARRSPRIEKQTADVATLIAMGSRIPRLIAEKLVRADEQEREQERLAKRSISEKMLDNLFEEGPCVALGVAIGDCFAAFVTRVQGSPVPEPVYHQRIQEYIDAKERLETLQSMAKLLREEGVEYARMLNKPGKTEERERIVDSICRRGESILAKAEPPVPQVLFEAVANLATKAKDEWVLLEPDILQH